MCNQGVVTCSDKLVTVFDPTLHFLLTLGFWASLSSLCWFDGLKGCCLGHCHSSHQGCFQWQQAATYSENLK